MHAHISIWIIILTINIKYILKSFILYSRPFTFAIFSFICYIYVRIWIRKLSKYSKETCQIKYTTFNFVIVLLLQFLKIPRLPNTNHTLLRTPHTSVTTTYPPSQPWQPLLSSSLSQPLVDQTSDDKRFSPPSRPLSVTVEAPYVKLQHFVSFKYI